jgi:RNA polymerase sigma factor (TIGR02999 family)
MGDVSRILQQAHQGDPHAAEKLLPLVYDELRRLAAAKLAHEQPGQTLDATALVHEVYLRLVDQPLTQPWQNQRHFLAAAAEAMRRILVEAARRKHSLKRGGHLDRVDLADVEPLWPQHPRVDLLALDEALDNLQREKPRQAELVKLRFFAGLTMPQVAQALGVSLATAENYWAYARSWLRLAISDNQDRPDRNSPAIP